MTSKLTNDRREAAGFMERDYAQHPPSFTPGYKSSVLRAPKQALISFASTLSEKTGPAFGHNMLGELDNDLIVNFAKPGEEAIGQRIVVHGRVLDQNARPVTNALVEFWQANAGGRYRHKREGYRAPLDPNFGGFGRTVTDEDGYYWFRTIKPGPYPRPNGVKDWRPAHIHLTLFGSGFAQRLVSQMYFEGDPLIDICPIVNTISDKDAIARLVARLDINNSIPMDLRAYRFDIVLRGRRSTFFENRREGN